MSDMQEHCSGCGKPFYRCQCDRDEKGQANDSRPASCSRFSDTPETDAVSLSYEIEDLGQQVHSAHVPTKFARRLERERDDAIAEATNLLNDGIRERALLTGELREAWHLLHVYGPTWPRVTEWLARNEGFRPANDQCPPTPHDERER